MAETSLARQLKKLAVPQTTLLIQDKIRKSFLFDHRDAASLDRELVFAYGTTGLQKLCTINPLFSKFESNLFSISYKDFQRSVQTTDANKKLDSKISEFLRMLSPYFLLREAHEALEWLVYRFHVHLYNVDDLIACALPHYNTSYFVRVVQLLDLDTKSRWLWLKPIQKSGVHLDYSTILNNFLTDLSFRKFVCDVAPRALKVFKDHKNSAVPVISFSMLTVRNALEKSKLLDDKLIISLFPYIMEGLSSNLTNYILGSYMVVSQILVKVKLNSEIIDKLIIKIFEGLNENLKKEALMILLLAFQTQSVKSLPKKVYSDILSSDETLKILLNLLGNVNAITLIKAFIKKTFFILFTTPHAEGKNRKRLKFLNKLFSQVPLDEKCITFSFTCLLKKFCKTAQSKNFKKNPVVYKKIVSCVVKKLELKYPDHFDKAFKKFLESSHPYKKMLCNLISRSVCSVKHEVIPNAVTTLSLGLYDANPNIRENSVKYLAEIVASQELSDNEFIKNSIYDRLLDDNPKVVLQILSSDVFINLLSKPKLLSVFENIFSRQIILDSKWYAVQMKSLDIIIKLFGLDESIYDILPVILNFIFPVNVHTVEGFYHLMNSKVSDIFLQKLLTCLKSKFEGMEEIKNKDFSEVNIMVINSLEEFIKQMDETSKIAFLSLLKSKIHSLKSCSFLTFYIYVIQYMLTLNSESQHNLLLISDLMQLFNSYFAQSKKLSAINNVLKLFKSSFPNNLMINPLDKSLEEFKVLYRKYAIKKVLRSLNKQEFPESLIYYTYFKIVSDLELNMECKSSISISDDSNNSYNIMNCLFNFCVLHLNSDKESLREYFTIMLSLLISCQLKSIQSTFSFLSTKWLKSSEILGLSLTCTSIAIALINKEQMNWIFDNPMIFFSIIKLIGDSNDKLRISSLNLLHLILLSSRNCKHPLACLGNEIFSKSEEIKTDCRQCFDYIGTWINSASETMNIKKPKQAEFQVKITVLNQILEFLHQNEVPYSMKYFLLSCLQNVNNTEILSSYIPVLYSHLSAFKEGKDNDEQIKILGLLLQKFTPETASSLTDKSVESKALLYCLNFSFNKDNDIDRRVQTLTLEILNEKFYSAIPSICVQQQVLEKLLNFYMTFPVDINIKVERVLRDICKYAYLFFKHVKDQELSVSKNTTLREVKKVRITKNSDSMNSFENDIWKKITVFLELIQSESNFLHKEILIPELFNLLNKSLDFDSHANVEYIKQLILSAIYNCCEQYGSQKNLEQYFQVELIVQCIRTSTNPKTHRQALLLLNLAAAMFPDHVLKNVMSIFVFMGSSLVRQDNSYSFQVISQTIETVLPSLCEASHQQTKTDGEQVVASVIRVFVDSLLDIPGHRQLPLFTKLITTLDPSKFLWIPLGQICDQYATVFHNISPDSTNWKVSPTLEFAVNLHKQFSPDIQIDTCIKLIDFLLILPDTKKQLELNPDKYEKIKEPFDVGGHSDKELQIYKYNVLSYMKIWLSSQAFHSQVSELSVKEQNNLESKYEQLLQSVLVFLQDRINSKKCDKDSKTINDQILLLYDLVYAINSLLPSSLFIQVIRRLLKSDEKEIQLRAVELLSAKLEQQKELFGLENHPLLLKLLKPLLKLVDSCLDENNKDKYSEIQQSALYALHLLCKIIGAQYPRKFYKVLNIAVSILDKCCQPELFVNALLCLAQLCRCLNVDILPRLNTFMPAIIKILQDEKVLLMSECFSLGIAAALQSIIENLGIFLSSYLEDIISSICIFSLKYFESSKKTVSEKFESLQTKLSNEIPLRILLPAIEKSYLQISVKNTKAVVPLMKILTQKLDCSEYEDILSCITQLQNFYITLLDFRNCNQSLSAEIISLVETGIISSFQTFVMKLSVSRFRTFFQKIYQWAVVTIEDQEQKYRISTFYKLTSEFSKSLKSLFSPMSRYLYTHISATLDSCNSSKSNANYFDYDTKLSQELLINILDTLKFCFMYSEEQLLDKENFELLMHPLVNQIENIRDECMYKNIIENHLSSCIAYFMTAVSDSALWKSLNYQILLKTRHESPDVRFASLQIILEVVKKMGDNYLVLLPESIPFLAEIMEDESTEVEQECQTVIIEMEKILGEPIRKYF